MIEYERRPEIAAVTVIAFPLRREMPATFTGRGRAVVTTRTGSGVDVCVIEARRQPGGRRMANIAFGSCLQMAHKLAGSSYAIVAARTQSNDLSVVDPGDWRKGRYVVAVLANVTRRNVTGRLAE